MASSESLFSDLELYGGEGYVPYESKDPLNDPKSFTFRYKVIRFVCLYKVKKHWFNLTQLKKIYIFYDSKNIIRPCSDVTNCSK